jgi:hypothetical protein
MGMDFHTAKTLVLAIVPLQEITVDLRNLGEPRQFTRTFGALQRAAKHLVEGQSLQSLAESTCIALASFGKWKVSESGVLARQTPSRFAVACEINDRK